MNRQAVQTLKTYFGYDTFREGQESVVESILEHRDVLAMEILEKFLESLKKGDCDIFIRRYWYMDSISEISARHGISESRIKSSLYRSRKKLWERVKHLYGKRI